MKTRLHGEEADSMSRAAKCQRRMDDAVRLDSKDAVQTARVVPKGLEPDQRGFY